MLSMQTQQQLKNGASTRDAAQGDPARGREILVFVVCAFYYWFSPPA
ncbi:MAG: hypothetical protein M3Z08_23005 [Chloroflexota bacterium]|nr:hypothetical protein [Chloroflexota bacterium]